MPRVDISIFNPAYADDIAFVTDSPKDNQLAIDAFQ